MIEIVRGVKKFVFVFIDFGIGVVEKVGIGLVVEVCGVDYFIFN